MAAKISYADEDIEKLYPLYKEVMAEGISLSPKDCQLIISLMEYDQETAWKMRNEMSIRYINDSHGTDVVFVR
jgi:hypothetical protein